METFFEVLETVIDVTVYIVMGFFGLFFIIFILAIIFGKRVIKKWEFEANFYNDKRQEIGEFDIEMKKFAKEEGDFALKAVFNLKHADLNQGNVVQIYLEDVLVMEGVVEKEGRIYLQNEHLKSDINDPQEGQVCRVMCSSVELFSEKLIID